MKARFSFHGARLQIQARKPGQAPALAELAEDFLHFRSERPETAADQRPIRIVLMGFSPGRSWTSPLIPVLPLNLLLRRGCRVSGWGKRRVCVYADGAWVTQRIDARGRRTMRVYSRDPARARELGYLAALSSIGEELERRGIQRLHALGLRENNRAWILAARPGGGKSTLALMAMKNNSIAIFSDEIILFEGPRVLPFPLRIAIHPAALKGLGTPPAGLRRFKRAGYPEKYLVPVPLDRIALPCAVASVSIGYAPRAGGAILAQASPSDQVRLFVDLIVGRGLPQMAEFLLRTDNLTRLARTAWARARVYLRLRRHGAEIMRWVPSQDAANSARTFMTAPGA